MTKETPISRYVLGYVLWAVSIVTAGIIGLIVRDAFNNGLVLSAASQAGVDKTADFYQGLQLRAVEPWTYVIYGIIMIVIVAFVEHYYREGATRHRLLPRFLLVTGIEIGVLALAHASKFVMNLALGGAASWTALTIVAVELLLTGVLIWFFRRTSNRPVLAK